MAQNSSVTTVFVHGFLDDAAVWNPLLSARARQTPTVVAELAGMGGRPDAPGPYTRAWLYRPDAPGLHSAVSMAHGYAGSRHHGIERFAEAVVADGHVVLLHDHRGFGDSGGEPRQDVDPWTQIADWRRALSHLEARPEVDPGRLGLWGTSYAGGHALVLGATDPRLRAVVAQVPTISGAEQARRRVRPEDLASFHAGLLDDERARAAGRPGARRAVVSADPAVPASYRAPDAVAFYLQDVPDGVWVNEVTVRSTLAATTYEPGVYVERISPTPLLMVVATHDTVTLSDTALAAYGRALEPKRLVTVPGGHFDPYIAAFATRLAPGSSNTSLCGRTDDVPPVPDHEGRRRDAGAAPPPAEPHRHHHGRRARRYGGRDRGQ